MKVIKVILAASALALAAGGALARDEAKDRQGFNEMDKNDDGFLTRQEANANKDVVAKWKDADRDNDGKLSRSEYLRIMAAKDANTVKQRVSKAMDRDGAKSEGSAAGGSAAGGGTRK